MRRTSTVSCGATAKARCGSRGAARRNRSIRTGSTISSPAGSPPGSRWPPPWSRKRGKKRASRPRSQPALSVPARSTSAAGSRTGCSARRSSSTTCGFPPASSRRARTVKSPGTGLCHCRRWPRSSRTPTARTSSPPTPRSSCSIACCATAPSGRMRRTTVRWRRSGSRRTRLRLRRSLTPANPPSHSPHRGRRHAAARAVAGPGLTCRIPISCNVSRTAFTACRISSGPTAPMQPTRNVSTFVSLPG